MYVGRTFFRMLSMNFKLQRFFILAKTLECFFNFTLTRHLYRCEVATNVMPGISTKFFLCWTIVLHSVILSFAVPCRLVSVCLFDFKYSTRIVFF